MTSVTAKTQQLLNVDSNAKTVKGQKLGVLTGIMYLAPADLSGFNVCAMAEIAGCKAPCLNGAGRGQMTMVQEARVKKTLWFFNDRQGFMMQMVKEIETLQRRAKKRNLTPAVRLNGTSDIKWENVRFEYEFTHGEVQEVTLFQLFPEVQFYDYTKIANRSVPANYHLTFSYSNRVEFQPYVARALKNPVNIAVVFESKELVQDKIRDGFMGKTVVDGDESDVRFYDGEGVVVALYAKGKAVHDKSGFVVRAGE